MGSGLGGLDNGTGGISARAGLEGKLEDLGNVNTREGTEITLGCEARRSPRYTLAM